MLKKLNAYKIIIAIINFCEKFSIEISWLFRKYSSTKNNSSTQCMHVSGVIVILHHPIDCLQAYFSYRRRGHTNTTTKVNNERERCEVSRAKLC